MAAGRRRCEAACRGERVSGVPGRPELLAEDGPCLRVWASSVCRWLGAAGLTVAAVTTEDLLGFVSACRQQTMPGRSGPNVVDMQGRRTESISPCWTVRREDGQTFRHAGPSKPQHLLQNSLLHSIPAPQTGPIWLSTAVTAPRFSGRNLTGSA